MAEVISTIKPAGGGDYTTLQAWEDAVDGDSNAQQTAECYSGGDLGAITFGGWAGATSATVHPKITVPVAERHGGDLSAGAYTTGQIAIETFGSATPPLDIEYLRLTSNSSSIINLSNEFATSDIIVNINNVIVNNGGITPGPAINVTANNESSHALTVNIRNLLTDNISTGVSLQSLSAKGGVGDLTATVQNCTLIGVGSTPDPARGIYIIDSGDVCNVTIENNIALDFEDGDFTSSGSPTVTSNNNLSSDATADDFSGSGHITGATTADVLADPDNDDFSLKADSAAIDAGKDLSGSFTTDIISNTRPQGSAFDIGAYELLQAEINIKDGSTSIADGETTPIDFGSALEGS